MSFGTLTQDRRSVVRAGGERGVAYLYQVFDCAKPLRAGARWALDGVDEVTLGRAHDRTTSRSREGATTRLALGVPDPWTSGTHARLQHVMGRWVIEDAGSKNGVRVDGERIDKATPLGDGAVVELGRTVFLFRDDQPTPSADVGDLDGASARPLAPGLRTLVPRLAHQFSLLAQIAPSGVSVVISGESGTGKELAARAVHLLSRRRGAFVPVNCGALPDELVESELFGHRKGAFTGATTDHPGLVRASDGGTLFLDEVGELPLEIQPAFLRALQEREVTPVGATRAVPVDLRLVSATHRRLEDLAQTGAFRADLLARLSGFTLELPPLRERLEDLGDLVAELLLRAKTPEVTFTVEAARALLRHDWPLNVRELEKALGAAAVLARSGVIGLEQLPASITSTTPRQADVRGEAPASGGERSEEDARRRDELAAMLRQHHGNVSAIARATGKARMQIQRWLKRYGLDPEQFRP